VLVLGLHCLPGCCLQNFCRHHSPVLPEALQRAKNGAKETLIAPHVLLFNSPAGWPFAADLMSGRLLTLYDRHNRLQAWPSALLTIWWGLRKGKEGWSWHAPGALPLPPPRLAPNGLWCAAFRRPVPSTAD